MPKPIVRCVLSGTYHKDREGLTSTYNELVAYGCQVISPHRLDFDAEETFFVRDNAERDISEEVIERHHLLAIKQSDFVWLHAPNGYVGISAALEIGYAIAHNIPVFSYIELSEPIFRPFVRVVPSVFQGIESLSTNYS